MRTTLITFILIAATAAFSQTDKTQQEVRAQAERLVCPVGITASQQGSPAAMWITSLKDSNKPAAELKRLHAGVHVDLSAKKQIKQVELAVYFLPPGARAVPVTGSQFAASTPFAHEDHKNFSLASGKSPSTQLDGDLLLGPVASVTHVSLMHVTFTDGSEWDAQNASSCSVKPNLYMPVKTR